MAQSADDDRLAWFDPDPRGILPLDRFHLPRRLARTLKTTRYGVTLDADFAGTMDGCAEMTADRPNTWINPRIRTLCTELHRMGYAHSIEVWDGADLVGGLYGVALGGAFFGESMFSRARDAIQQDRARASGGAASPLRLYAIGHPVRHPAFDAVRSGRNSALGIPRPPCRRAQARLRSSLRQGGRSGGLAAAVDDRYVVDGMVHGRQGRARREHPAGERQLRRHRPALRR